MGLELGYDSVMIDGSRLILEENISVTRRVVEISHPHHIPVEAELGAVLGHERGPLPSYKELFRTGKGFTEPREVEQFVKETKVAQEMERLIEEEYEVRGSWDCLGEWL